MSHIATVSVQFKDAAALRTACRTLDYRIGVHGTWDVFGVEVEGLPVYLPGWHYPVVITKDNELKYDNYNGNWGDVKHLNNLRQRYAVEAAKNKARQQGFSVAEKRLANGQVQLVCAKG
jgi:hypothetical protein